MQSRLLPHGLAAVLLASVLVAAQDSNDARARDALRAALTKTSKVEAIAFKSLETQDDALRRRLPIGGESEDTQVTGTVTGDVLAASIGFDDDNIVAARGRMLARRGDGEWKLRRSCLADGRPLPFVADPRLLVETLANLPDDALQVTHVESGTVKDAEVRIYGFTVSGRVADELGLTGALPRATGGHMMMIFGGGGLAEPPRPEVSIDLAVSVDAESGYVVRVRSRSYTKSQLPGNVQVRFAGADGTELAEEEEVEAETPADKDAPLQFRKGLPQRHLGKDTSLIEFDLALSRHGEAKAPAVSEAGRKLLGLR
ncbi:MAG: hypothetical protein R3F56_00830 [Planctomycetota bacterium]